MYTVPFQLYSVIFIIANQIATDCIQLRALGEAYVLQWTAIGWSRRTRLRPFGLFFVYNKRNEMWWWKGPILRSLPISLQPPITPIRSLPQARCGAATGTPRRRAPATWGSSSSRTRVAASTTRAASTSAPARPGTGWRIPGCSHGEFETMEPYFFRAVCTTVHYCTFFILILSGKLVNSTSKRGRLGMGDQILNCSLGELQTRG